MYENMDKEVAFINTEFVYRTILETLPKDKTDAIYIFGSFNTEFFDEDSDIDIGWFCHDIDWGETIDFEEKLEKLLGRKVDLVMPDKDKRLILHEILCGFPIGPMSDSFCIWFDEIITELQDFCETVKDFV